MSKTNLTKTDIREMLEDLGVKTTGKETKAQLQAMLDLELDEQEPEEKAEPKMAALREARKRYHTEKVNGKLKIDNGDPIATILRPLTPEQVAAVADKVLEEDNGSHASRYAHLNPGQMRMNSGNRIRGAIKRGEATMEDLELIVEAVQSTPEAA